jgi:hypothetical protein
MGVRPKMASYIGLRPDSMSPAHTLPTPHTLDPDLAHIVGVWDRLAEEVKETLIRLVNENMPV